jgi:hypothetical protein
MKTWGTSGRGALLAVLLLVLSGAVIPLGARAQANVVSGTVTDCASLDPVGAQVFLVDVHAPASERNTQAAAGSGYFTFPNVQPSYYMLRVKPDSSTHFQTETAPFRVDGITDVPPKRLCVDKMPDKTRNLEVTVVDGATNSANETVTFQEFTRTDENVTNRGINGYDFIADNVSLVTRPLGWASETLTYADSTTPIGGVTLVRGTGPAADYDYTEVDAYNGVIHISNVTVQIKLENTLFGRSSRGYLEITYENVSKSSNLAHGQISNATFWNDGNPITPYWSTVQLNNETGSLLLDRSDWRYGSSGNVLTVSYSWSGAISGAGVTVRFAPRDQAVSSVVNTNPSGKAFFSVWDNAQFEVKVEFAGYLTALVLVNVSGSNVNLQVPLIRGYKVRSYAWEGARAVTTADGLTGALINTDWTVNKGIQVLKPVVVDNLLTFNAYNGTWKLIVDANGRKAVTQNVVVNGANVFPPDIFFEKSLEEPIRTEINFLANSDWNNITVWRNLTLLPDSVFPGLDFAEVRNIHWQLDLNFGNRDGNLNGSELAAFQARLQEMGPFYVVSDNLLTVNGKAYNSTSYTVAALGDAGPNGNITITTRADYTLKQLATAPIAANKARYFVNVTTIADKNVSVYQNYSYRVQMPKGYEMTSKTTTGNVVTRDFVQVEVDPGIDAVVPNPRANLIVDQSLLGVARAEVEGPVGKVFVKNTNQDSYLAWVANNTAVVFSANKTSDRLNQAVNAKDANFTWSFNVSGGPAYRYGIWTTFDFGAPGTNYSVNLTVTQVNPDNRTYRVINVSVDNINPVAVISTNRTSVDNQPSLTVKEDLVTRFNGGNSTDSLWGTLSGELAEWNWDFDSDGTRDQTGKLVNQNYSKPGTFNATLWVVDRVGHRSANQTMNVTVLDTTPPVPHLAILEDITWREPAQLSEDINYWFNVSRTTDNSLNATADNVNLTYTFVWGDATNNTPPLTGLAALNVSHTYATYGDWKLSINVTDAAGNRGWLNRTLVVQADTTAHPDLAIIAGTLKISPPSPEEGQLTTFRVNVTNGKDKIVAQDLKIQFALIVKGRDSNGTATSVRWLKADGTAATSIAPGENVTVEFKYAFATLGNKTIKITIWDGQEPPKWIDDSNKITTSLVVREGGWKIWAWVGAFFFIIVGIPMIIWVVRKVRAGELHLPRRRPKEGEDEDEEDEEEDEGEEKEGKGGKKRL